MMFTVRKFMVGFLLLACVALTAKGDRIGQLFSGVFGNGGPTINSSHFYSDPKIARFIDDIQRGNVKRVKAGLADGISANAPGKGGFRPIFFVFFAKKPGVLNLLLDAGADPNARLLNGTTPLMAALGNGQWEAAQNLIDVGAEATLKNDQGKTALDLACRYMHGLPVNKTNKEAISNFSNSLARRHLSLPCTSESAKFLN